MEKQTFCLLDLFGKVDRYTFYTKYYSGIPVPAFFEKHCKIQLKATWVDFSSDEQWPVKVILVW